MSYHYCLASASDGFSDTEARSGRIVLPPFSTVGTKADRMCSDDVVCTTSVLDIVGHVSLVGQPVAHGGVGQVMWRRLSLCVGVYVCSSGLCSH